MSLAARYRTATVTVKDWADSFNEYQDIKKEHGSLGSLHAAHDSATWPSTPIVFWMHEAANGYGGTFGNFQITAGELIKNKKTLKTQAAVYQVLLPTIHPIIFKHEFSRRLTLWSLFALSCDNLEEK